MSVDRFLTIIIGFFLLAGSLPTLAADQNVIYVNGIQNTLPDFIQTKRKIQTLLNESVNHVGAVRRSFNVTGVWNPQGWTGEEELGTLLKDKKRLFVLKTAEEQYSSSFVNLLSPFDQNLVPSIASAQSVARYVDQMLPGSNSLEADGLINAGNLRRTQFTVNAIVANVQAKKPAVVVAHSQGNLLVNLAYAKLVVNNGVEVNRMLKVVNVANTSFWSVNGLNFTHAGDAALYSAATGFGIPDFSLESLPIAESWNRTTPRCMGYGRCSFLLGPAPFGSGFPSPPALGPDAVLDHSITETYLSNGPVSVLDSQRITFTVGANRFRDRFEDFMYTATAALYADAPYWLGTFTPVDCQAPPPGTLYFWERPCFNIGAIDGQYSSTFYFPAAGGKVTFDTNANARIRKVFDTEWNATSLPILRLSMPTEVLVPWPQQSRYVRYSGVRQFELNVDRRTATEIGGSFVVSSSSGAAVDITPTYPGNVIAPIATRAVGTWSARLVPGPMPTTIMNGWDLCFSDNGGLNYRNLDSQLFSPGNGNFYTSLGWGAVGGPCTFGR